MNSERPKQLPSERRVRRVAESTSGRIELNRGRLKK